MDKSLGREEIIKLLENNGIVKQIGVTKDEIIDTIKTLDNDAQFVDSSKFMSTDELTNLMINQLIGKRRG